MRCERSTRILSGLISEQLDEIRQRHHLSECMIDCPAPFRIRSCDLLAPICIARSQDGIQYHLVRAQCRTQRGKCSFVSSSVIRANVRHQLPWPQDRGIQIQLIKQLRQLR